MDRKNLETAINKNLSSYGFQKKSLTWYRECSTSLQVINLQKSSNSNQYYLNICFVPSKMNIEGLPFPKEQKCPIRIRLGAAFPKEKEKFDQIFDLENYNIVDSIRLFEITNIFTEFVLPFLKKMEECDLKIAIESGLFNNGAVSLSAKKHLGINI